MQTLTALSLPFDSIRRMEIFLPSLVGLCISVATGVLFGLLLQQGVPHPYDKVVHIVFFLIFSSFALTLIKDHFLLPLIGLIILAAASEILQGALPHREMSYLDMMANLTGIALAVFFTMSPRIISSHVIRSKQPA